MSHNYYCNRFLAVLVSLTSVLFMAVSAKAEIVDLGVLEPDVTYDVPIYKEVKASYTPSVTGPVKILWTCSPMTLYSSPDLSEKSIVDGSHSYTDGGQLISYASLEGGHTYYLHTQMSLMAGTLVIREGDTKIELVRTDPCIDPSDPNFYNDKFSVSKNYRINLSFNYPVTVGNCFLIAGSERQSITPVVSNATVSFDVNDIIMSFYNRDLIKEGDSMTLRVLQIKDATNSDNKYNENGKLEIDFKMAAKPAELVETRGFSTKVTNNPFNSYYVEGDENGNMTLVFDRNIDAAKAPVAQLAYGNPDNLELGVYRENVMGDVDGTTVSFDFSGKLRRRIDMLPGAEVSQLPNDLYISYSNIFSEDGQMAYTGMVSNPTGFSSSYVINELLYSVAADFTPARGSSLKPGDEVEIWVMNGTKISYENICFDYTDGGEARTAVIAAEDVRTEIDQDSLTGDDMLFHFTMPEFTADAGTVITLYMSGVTCADGLDHSSDVRGNYTAGTSDVDAIGADDADVVADVFDVTGKPVLRNVTRLQMNSLDKGVYIHNGKKIMIR